MFIILPVLEKEYILLVEKSDMTFQLVKHPQKVDNGNSTLENILY